MKNLKIFAVAMMLLTAGMPALADNDKGNDKEKCEEIDNYDFLYSEGYDEDFEFESIDNVLDEAFSHMGARYRSGQAGPNAFDCSGFTSYVFKNMGIDLNRSSRAQFDQGDPVDKDKLQTGDLVFFTSPRSGRSIGHVGIVVDVDPISGSFNFIHASTKGVKVSNSNERYYSRRYVGARRVM
ncbi:C40 family peptidase [uncultured Prevotella sp.]|uniref:C40 family peptidase n=1 Tax=uncultured Prevotella sp. TaxID=159272 RepID=UPI002612F2C5|nr:C40 family peptidase [uncultured Prevotella sp.]